jgi:acyl-[acyl carrier protein]--UDP-N-acetylglucosamine O-acyltransferase
MVGIGPKRGALMPGRFAKFLRENDDLVSEVHEGSDDNFDTVSQTGTVWSTTPGTVCQASNASYLALALANDNIVAVIADQQLAKMYDRSTVKPIIFGLEPEKLFLKAHLARLHEGRELPGFISGRSDKADICSSAVLQGPVAVADGAKIGPNATIIGPAVIGEDVTIEANAVVGAAGLYAKDVDGKLTNMPHFGGVRIGAGALILSGAVVVRSAYYGSWTTIGAQAHVGVQSNIGHDAVVGARTLISSNVVISGRARIGAGCWIGASASIANGLSIGDGASVKIGSVVIADVAAKQTVSGNFALDHRRNLLRHARGLKGYIQ